MKYTYITGHLKCQNICRNSIYKKLLIAHYEESRRYKIFKKPGRHNVRRDKEGDPGHCDEPGEF